MTATPHPTEISDVARNGLGSASRFEMLVPLQRAPAHFSSRGSRKVKTACCCDFAYFRHFFVQWLPVAVGLRQDADGQRRLLTTDRTSTLGRLRLGNHSVGTLLAEQVVTARHQSGRDGSLGAQEAQTAERRWRRSARGR